MMLFMFGYQGRRCAV